MVATLRTTTVGLPRLDAGACVSAGALEFETGMGGAAVAVSTGGAARVGAATTGTTGLADGADAGETGTGSVAAGAAVTATAGTVPMVAMLETEAPAISWSAT